MGWGRGKNQHVICSTILILQENQSLTALLHLRSGTPSYSIPFGELLNGQVSSTFILEAGWISSVMDTLSCWSLLLTSLEQQMLTELRTCQELYSTKERLSMTNVPLAPLLKRPASFLGSMTLRGRLSPAMAALSLLQQAGERKEGPKQPEAKGTGIGRGSLQTAKFCHVAKTLYDKSLCQTCWKYRKRERERGGKSSQIL